MKKLAALFAALPLTAGIGFADAGGLVDIGIVDRNTGQQLEVYRHHGRLYVAGTPGNRYSIVLHNKTGGRLLTVVSVDGVNVLDGQTAALAQPGYVLPAWQSAEVSGWRKSMDEVAAFYFTSVADSYAGRTDRPQNVGVIGVAVYREAAPSSSPPVLLAPPARSSDAPGAAEGAASNATAKAAAAVGAARQERPAEATAAAQSERRLGTGHGERLSAPTQYTEFRRASDTPVEIVSVHYDSRARLLAQGVIPRPSRSPLPNPFPGGFTPDPRS